MAMTAQVKAELASTTVTKTCCLKAEVSSMLRFAGGLHIVSGQIVVEAELDTGAAARRLRRDIAEIYGHPSDVVMVSGHGIRKSSRYVVRVVKDGEALARQTGLLDGRGRPVRGLPPQVVSGGNCDAVAAWRGAFLAHGSLTEPGRSSALEVSCPGPEAALALVGAARRLGVSAKAREVRGADRVVVRDGEAIGALLTRMGAQDTRLTWRSGGCAARCAPRPTGWPTSTTRTCGGRRGLRSPPPRVWSGRWRFSPTPCPTIWPRRASCASSIGRRRWRSWAVSPIRR